MSRLYRYGSDENKETDKKISAVGNLNNFITDLWDEAIRKNASDVVILPDTQSGVFIRGNLERSGPVVGSDEIIEDMVALGFDINTDTDRRFYYPTADGFIHEFRMNVMLDYQRKPSVTFRYIQSTVKKDHQS